MNDSSAIRSSQVGVEALDPVEVAATLDGETAVIDLRSVLEWRNARIPGAWNVPPRQSDGLVGAGLERLLGDDLSRRVIVYSKDDSAAAAAGILRAQGYRRAAYLNGGFAAWQSENRIVESGAARLRTIERKER